MQRGKWHLLFAAAALTVAMGQVAAFSSQGHMVGAAIAYEELKTRDPAVLDAVVEILLQHPDRGTFEVAVDEASGDERARRLVMEAARWPDDIRKGMFDHPTWHYASRPLLDLHHPPAAPPRDAVSGSAIEAFALNLGVLRDVRAPLPDRAIALCWVMHLVGDIHQPLHAADEYSLTYPQGDRGGGLEYVLDPVTHQAITLHGWWDQAGTLWAAGPGEPAQRAAQGAALRAAQRAAQRAWVLRAQLPRGQFPELSSALVPARDFTAWAAESYALARTQVYTADLATGSSPAQAPELSAPYLANSSRLDERRVTLSGYRLADTLIDVLSPTRKPPP